jgi:hypothetical protein
MDIVTDTVKLAGIVLAVALVIMLIFAFLGIAMESFSSETYSTNTTYDCNESCDYALWSPLCFNAANNTCTNLYDECMVPRLITCAVRFDTDCWDACYLEEGNDTAALMDCYELCHDAACELDCAAGDECAPAYTGFNCTRVTVHPGTDESMERLYDPVNTFLFLPKYLLIIPANSRCRDSGADYSIGIE